MQGYTRIYLDTLGYDETDFIPCELCEKRSVDIHHIIARSKHKELLEDPRNLMAVCRDCHEKYGDRKYLIPMLLKIHKRIMQIAGVKTNYKWFEFYINKYET